MFCKHIIHLCCHVLSKCVCSWKKSNKYMTRLPLVIQEMNNKNKCINTFLDIQRSKDIVHVIHDWRARETNLSFVHSIIFNKSSFLNFSFDGEFNRGFNPEIYLLKKWASTNDKGTSSFAMNNKKSSSNFFYEDQFYYKEPNYQKKKIIIIINLKAGLDFFFAKFFFPSIPSSYYLIHSFQSSQWLTSKCFRNAKISFVDL